MTLDDFIEIMTQALKPYKDPDAALNCCCIVSERVYRTAREIGIYDLSLVSGFCADENGKSKGHVFLTFKRNKEEFILDFTLNQFYRRLPKPFPFIAAVKSPDAKAIYRGWSEFEPCLGRDSVYIAMFVQICKEAERLKSGELTTY